MTVAVKEKRKNKRKQPVPPSDYRKPVQMKQIRIFWNNNAFYVCPRCKSSLDREYMSYCNRCGQCLNWKNHKRAECICLHWDGSRK